MTEKLPLRSVALFFAKFLVLAPLCLIVWWGLLPYYAQGLAFVTGAVLKYALLRSIDAVSVVARGKINTETVLAFVINGRERSMEVGLLVTNVAPYVALVLATEGLRFRRRLRVLAVGTGILVLGHALYIVTAFIFVEAISKSPDVPTALAQLFLTLPFLLWVVLAYWDKLVALFMTEQGEETNTR